MAEKVKLKVRRPSPEREAEDTLDTVEKIVSAIGEGVFDAYLDVIFKAFDDRIKKSLEEEGDGELPTRDRSEKLRPMRADRAPVIPVEGRHYRLRGEKYKGAVVVYMEMAGFNTRGVAMVLVEAITGNDLVVSAQQYKVPLTALEEIPDMKSKPLPNISDAPKCRKCGNPVKYSGRGRPRSFCDDCLKVTQAL